MRGRRAGQENDAAGTARPFRHAPIENFHVHDLALSQGAAIVSLPPGPSATEDGDRLRLEKAMILHDALYSRWLRLDAEICGWQAMPA